MSKPERVFHLGYDVKLNRWNHENAQTEREAIEKLIAKVQDEERVPKANINVHSIYDVSAL
jgi:hypothetical protein